MMHTVVRILLLTILWGAGFSGTVWAAGRVFYDGSEAGNTDLWSDPGRNRCTSVTVAEDGGSGPYAGSRMLRCQYTGSGFPPSYYESLLLNINSLYTNEFLLRVKFRRSATWDLSGVLNVSDKGQKILRFFQLGPYHDLFEVTGHADNGTPASNNANSGAPNDGELLPTYWSGDHPSDLTNLSTGWHEIAYYISMSSGTVKVWHDGTLIRNDTGQNFAGAKWYDFTMTSNGESPAFTGYTYYDEFEVYADDGTGGTGLMSDNTITQGGGGGVGDVLPQGTRPFVPSIHLF